MTDTAAILAGIARLRSAYAAQRNAPPVGDFNATVHDLAARAEVAPVATAWSLDVRGAK